MNMNINKFVFSLKNELRLWRKPASYCAAFIIFAGFSISFVCQSQASEDKYNYLSTDSYTPWDKGRIITNFTEQELEVPLEKYYTAVGNNKGVIFPIREKIPVGITWSSDGGFFSRKRAKVGLLLRDYLVEITASPGGFFYVWSAWKWSEGNKTWNKLFSNKYSFDALDLLREFSPQNSGLVENHSSSMKSQDIFYGTRVVSTEKINLEGIPIIMYLEQHSDHTKGGGTDYPRQVLYVSDSLKIVLSVKDEESFISIGKYDLDALSTAPRAYDWGYSLLDPVQDLTFIKHVPVAEKAQALLSITSDPNQPLKLRSAATEELEKVDMKNLFSIELRKKVKQAIDTDNDEEVAD